MLIQDSFLYHFQYMKYRQSLDTCDGKYFIIIFFQNYWKTAKRLLIIDKTYVNSFAFINFMGKFFLNVELFNTPERDNRFIIMYFVWDVAMAVVIVKRPLLHVNLKVYDENYMKLWSSLLEVDLYER